MEFSRAWQERAGASQVDPAALARARAETGPDDPDDHRLLAYARALLELRLDDADGLPALARFQGALLLGPLMAAGVGLLAGASLLTVSLPPPEVRPVNLFVFVGEGVLLPAAFGVGTTALSLGAGRALLKVHWLAWILGGLERRALHTKLGSLAGRVLRTSGVSGPLFASWSHLLWICGLGAFLALAGWRFAFADYLFSWSSTLPVSEAGVRSAFSLLAFPLEWVPGVDAPSAQQVTVSHYASLEGLWSNSTGEPALDDALRKGWFALLLAGVAFWGLLPRVLGFGVARIALRRQIRAALASPAHQGVLAALDRPAVTVTARGDGAGRPSSPLPPSSRPAAQARRVGLDLVTFATPRPPDGVLERLGLERLGLSGQEHSVDDDDDDDAMSAVLDSLAGPGASAGGALVVFDFATSPGRLREAFLRDVLRTLGEVPVHVLLSGEDAWRSSPRGRSADQRRASWLALAKRAGLAEERVHSDGAAR